MLKFIARRALQSLATILIIVSTVFLVLNLSGDPIRMMVSRLAAGGS